MGRYEFVSSGASFGYDYGLPAIPHFNGKCRKARILLKVIRKCLMSNFLGSTLITLPVIRSVPGAF